MDVSLIKAVRQMADSRTAETRLSETLTTSSSHVRSVRRNAKPKVFVLICSNVGGSQKVRISFMGAGKPIAILPVSWTTVKSRNT